LNSDVIEELKAILESLEDKNIKKKFIEELVEISK
jgi:hypothetical protein